MEKIGQIISVDNKVAMIEVKRVSACGEKCGSCSGGCKGTGIYIEADNSIEANPGQFVKVDMETNRVMKAAFVVYVLPLIMLVVGIISGLYIHDSLNLVVSSDIFSFGLGFLLMVMAYSIVKVFDKSYKSNNRIRYIITRVLS